MRTIMLMMRRTMKLMKGRTIMKRIMMIMTMMVMRLLLGFPIIIHTIKKY